MGVRGELPRTRLPLICNGRADRWPLAERVRISKASLFTADQIQRSRRPDRIVS